VVHNGTVVYERGFGVRELGKPEPITPDTVFQIASLSKSLSSTLVVEIICFRVGFPPLPPSSFGRSPVPRRPTGV